MDSKQSLPEFSSGDLALLQDAITLNERLQKVVNRKTEMLEKMKKIQAEKKVPHTRLKSVLLRKGEAKLLRKWDRNEIEFQELSARVSKTEQMTQGVLARYGTSLEEMEKLFAEKVGDSHAVQN